MEVAAGEDRTIELPPAWQGNATDQVEGEDLPAAESDLPAEAPQPEEDAPSSTTPAEEVSAEVPQAGALCAPCNSGQDCGGDGDFCLQNSETGENFCGQSCSPGTCPTGFSCQAIGGGGQVINQCIPDSETCSGGASGVDPGASVGDCGNAYESEVLELVNQERANNGLGPLACDQAASQVAHAYSQDMCDEGFFSHTGLDGSTPTSRLQTGGAQFVAAGENIAAGQPSPATVMQGWMQSSGHRSNILNSMWTHLGVGYVKCGAYDTRWTQDFLRK